MPHNLFYFQQFRMRNVANVLDASPDSKNETSTLFGSSNSFHPIIKSASDS